jgi:predicted ATPase
VIYDTADAKFGPPRAHREDALSPCSGSPYLSAPPAVAGWSPCCEYGHVARRVSSRVFIGRGEELAQIDAARERVRGGEAGTVLVGGEAGVGKTRLVAEALARAQAAGDWVLTGNCAALSGASVPFLPIIEALSGLPAEVSDDAPDELTGLLDRDGPSADIRPAAPGRVFELLLTLLRKAGRSRPVLLAIEDVHWADRSTLDLLAYLIRNRRDEQLLVIATFREEDLDRHAEFRGWLAEAYGGGAERITLARFGREEHAELLAGVLGALASPALSQTSCSGVRTATRSLRRSCWRRRGAEPARASPSRCATRCDLASSSSTRPR